MSTATLGRRFQMEGEPAEGRFSTLQRAVDRATGRPVVLRALGSRSPEERSQILREGRALARLRHRNLPQALDLLQVDGQMVLVLDDLPSSTLREVVERDGPLSADRVRRLADQVLSVLEFLHGQDPPIVHRDLRPDTVLVSPHGVLKVAEFGLARILETGGVTLFRGQGDPVYAPAEQLAGDPSHPGNDLYSAGAVLLFAATAADPPSSRDRAFGGKATPFPSDLPEDLAALLEAMLQPDPARRPASAAEARALLAPPPAPEAPPESLEAPPPADYADRFPFVDLAQLDIDRNLARILSETVAHSIQGVCIGRLSPNEITVAVKDPTQIYIFDNVAYATRGVYRPNLVKADPALIDQALDFIYGCDHLAPTTTFGQYLVQRRLDTEEIVVTSSTASGQAAEVAGEVVEAVDRLIKEAIAAGASDIHLEPYDNETLLRYRIDGMLHVINAWPPALANPMVKRIKVLGNLDIAQERVPQDGRISLRVGKLEYNLRVSLIPVPAGESVVMRVLKKGSFDLRLHDLGLSADLEARFQRLLAQPYGMILSCGPTGSGKTTTLYASLKELQRPDRKLLTVEDPIEYRMPGIMQVQVNMAPREEEKRVSFSRALREFLRQDPDIILVGEIRDPETAGISVQAALTGHMLLSTIHTNDSLGIVARLVDMDCEPFLIGSTLLGGLGQRLARKICQECREEIAVPEGLRPLFAEHGVEEPRMFAGRGCNRCFKTGYQGRLGLFELLVVDSTIRALINRAAPEAELLEAAVAGGYRPLLHDGMQKVVQGLVTVEEVQRVCKTL